MAHVEELRELAKTIERDFRAKDRVDEVNIHFEDERRKIVFTVLVDMPGYDRQAIDELLDVELEWAERAAECGVRIRCVYLPSAYVEPDTRLTTEAAEVC